MAERSFAEKKSKSVYEQVKEAEKKDEKLPEQFKKKSQSFVKMLIYYSIPLVSVGVFVGILIFGTVPSVKGILNYIDEKEEKEKKVEGLDKEISKLEGLREQEYQIILDLATIDKIVSSNKTQVAKFVGEIEALAEKYDLEESKHESGEQIKKIEEDMQEESESLTAAIIHIPTTSEYVATFDSITEFLNALYKKDDFIIVSTLDMQGYRAREYFASLQETQGEQVSVDLSLSDVSWTMEVTFEKYQFSKGFSQYIDENMVSITTDPDNDTLQFIRDRYSE